MLYYQGQSKGQLNTFDYHINREPAPIYTINSSFSRSKPKIYGVLSFKTVNTDIGQQPFIILIHKDDLDEKYTAKFVDVNIIDKNKNIISVNECKENTLYNFEAKKVFYSKE